MAPGVGLCLTRPGTECVQMAPRHRPPMSNDEAEVEPTTDLAGTWSSLRPPRSPDALVAALRDRSACWCADETPFVQRSCEQCEERREAADLIERLRGENRNAHLDNMVVAGEVIELHQLIADWVDAEADASRPHLPPLSIDTEQGLAIVRRYESARDALRGVVGR